MMKKWRVEAHTKAKTKAAKDIIVPRRLPTRGIHFSRNMIGLNNIQWPNTFKIQAANLSMLVESELSSCSSLKHVSESFMPNLQKSIFSWNTDLKIFSTTKQQQKATGQVASIDEPLSSPNATCFL